jgi:Ca-activated chloride channel homolog
MDHGDDMTTAGRACIRQLLAGALTALLGVLTSPLTSGLAAAAEPPSTIIVFDGSGSMWGRIGGDKDKDSKFGIAREALRKALARTAPTTRVGLAAFGHRRKADCSDTEVMLPPEPLDPARIMAPLEKFNPKGKGPLVAAMKEAAAALAKAPGAASLVLIHDDPDNCAQDPCAAAEELAKAQPQLAVHVISIQLAKTDSQRMACVPRLTGGRHFDVSDAAGLGTAIEDAMKLASLDAKPAAVSPAPAAAAKVLPAPVPAPVVETTGPPGLKLSASLGAGGPAVVVPLTWKVTRAGAPATAPPLAATRAANLDLAVPAGSYVVEVQQGLISMRETVDVKPQGATRHTVALQAGAARVSAVLQKGTPPLEQAVFAISDGQAPAGTIGRTVWTGGADAAPIFLPVGTWRISAELDRARAERTITVTAGSMTDAALVLGAGRLRVKATDRDGGPALDRVTFRITEDDADSSDGRREVARSTAAEPEFTLPAGTYYLSARHGHAEVRERVAVNAGDDLTRSLAIALGRLTLQSRIAGSAAAPETGYAYAIERMDVPQDAIRSRATTARLELPAGQYRVSSQLGAQNARVVREVEIKPGTVTTVTFDHAVATIQLKLGGVQKSPAADVMWDVRDQQNRSVWQTIQAEPRAYLAAGRYQITVESRDRRGRLEVDVKGGETRIVEVPFE